MKRLLGLSLLALGTVVLGLVTMIGTAVAGGWVVSSLDSVPAPRAGVPVEVGFVVRGHGVTPVDIRGGVGIAVTSPDGVETFFAAEREGSVGHYVAEVMIAEPGTYSWAVRPGDYPDQDLGRIEVADRTAVRPADSGYRWPGWLRIGLPVVAAVLAAVSLVDFATTRRRLAV